MYDVDRKQFLIMQKQRNLQNLSNVTRLPLFQVSILALLGAVTSCRPNESAGIVPDGEVSQEIIESPTKIAESPKKAEPVELVSIDGPVSFNRDIQPILSEYCYHCHGPDSGSREPKSSPLRLDQEKGAFALRENGKPVIIKGNSRDSYLMQLVRSSDRNLVMPPDPSTSPHGKIMKPSDIELLHRWIEEGAVYEDHWAYIAPKKNPLPKILNEDWARNEIDYFVAAKHAEVGLKPNEQEARNRLIRRLYLDLTGLPPSAKELDKILNDQRDFETVYLETVNQLMETDGYAEHWARHWLDVARYGDTHGIHLDNYRSIWPYRDWVISAFKKNMPFDQFTREQIAGDMMPDPSIDQVVATGFNRCNATTGEGGAIPEEYQAIYAQDRADTVASAWLGLTFGCAACHDHKFDAISQKENYQLTAFFRNTSMTGLDGNQANHPPFLRVTPPDERERLRQVESEIAEHQKQLTDYRNAHEDQYLNWVVSDQLPSGTPDHHKLSLPLHDAVSGLTDTQDQSYQSTKPLKWVNGPLGFDSAAHFSGENVIDLGQIGDFENNQPFSFGLWLKAPQSARGAAYAKMKSDNVFRGYDLYLVNGKLSVHIINTFPGDSIKVSTQANYPDNQWMHVVVTYDGKGKAAGTKIHINGKSVPLDVQNDSLKGSIKTDATLKLGTRTGDLPAENITLHDFKMFDTSLTAEEVKSIFVNAGLPRAQTLARENPGEAKTTYSKLTHLKDYYFTTVNTTALNLYQKIENLEQEKSQILARGTDTLVMDDRKDAEPHAHILIRGSYADKGERVTPDTPASLPPMGDLPRNRLGLAEWLTKPENPLPARVTVNRYWYYLFGRGISETNGDFGVMGARPSHPALLDWLAADFVEHDWDLHHLLRTIVTSATYRQSGKVGADKLEKDPLNLYLSRGPRYRMDGEQIRDLALKASGLLHPKVGGPPVKPYQPEGVWSSIAMTVSNTRSYKADSGDKLYRRSLYTFWKRMAPHPAMEIFNAPSREISCVQRDRTNTPLQAFVLLNDPQFVEASRHLAEKALKQADTDKSRIDYIAKSLVARPMTSQEHETILTSLAEIRARIALNPDEAAKLTQVGESKPDASVNQSDLAAWTLVANLILNMDETITK